MSQQDDLQKLITNYERRLQKLKEQKASFGSMDPPIDLLTEIGDCEANIERLQAELAELEQTTEPPAKITTTEPDPKLASFRAQPRIFLCHASEDKPQVADLYHRLKAAGYRPWLDKYDLLPGQNWRREIEKIIRDPYSLVLVCLSNNSITKRGVVQQEITWALDILDQMPEETIYLIPVRLEECPAPERLSKLHWVDLFEPEGFEYLTRALNYEIGKRQVVPAPEPVTPAKIEVFSEPELQPAPTKLPKILTPQHPFEPELIRIPAGKFLMGSDPSIDKHAGETEQPQHSLYLPDYSIAKTPVTNAEYRRFIEAGSYQDKSWWTRAGWEQKVRAGWSEPRYWRDSRFNQPNQPVVGVSWFEGVIYCRWLAQMTGKAYRLPTEAEWEKAARGTDGRLYPWGNEWDAKRCNTKEGGKGASTPVGAYSKGVSPYGLLDMAGNVWEWCATKWPKPYPYDVTEDEWAVDYLEGADKRVLRGGSWGDSGGGARCAYRLRDLPHDRGSYFGCRVVVSPIL